MRASLFVCLLLAMLALVAANGYDQYAPVSYYPSSTPSMNDIDLSRFRELIDPEEKEKKSEETEEEAKDAPIPPEEEKKEEEEEVKEEEEKKEEEKEEEKAEEKEEEVKEEEKEEEEKEERERPSRPEKKAGEMVEELLKEDEIFKNFDRQALQDAGARNMHIVGDDTEENNKEKELADALQAVKDQIVYKANQIKSEKRWTKEVTAIIESYVKKTRRVNANIRQLQAEVKELFLKKKQIENMILQRKLERKLAVATGDLETLREALKRTRDKEQAFHSSQDSIRETIAKIEAALARLRGESAPPPAGAEEKN